VIGHCLLVQQTPFIKLNLVIQYFRWGCFATPPPAAFGGNCPVVPLYYTPLFSFPVPLRIGGWVGLGHFASFTLIHSLLSLKSQVTNQAKWKGHCRGVPHYTLSHRAVLYSCLLDNHDVMQPNMTMLAEMGQCRRILVNIGQPVKNTKRVYSCFERLN